ncbi:MAG: Uma2 family endonuclease [Microscillaceae bacterium]|nr:Uma2 family endonuclease [Microscillaceae bacterium]
METITTAQLSEYEKERGKPMPSKNHGLIQSNLTGLLFASYRKTYSFPTELTLHLGEKDYVPDICIYPKMTFNGRQDEIRMTEVPITAIEIISPTQGQEEIMKKFETYFAHGVQSCWFVQTLTDSISIFLPDNQVLVFHQEILSDPTSRIAVDLREVFE